MRAGNRASASIASRAAGALASALAVIGIGAASAQAQAGAGIHASFLPNGLGARTALTFAFALHGGEEGIPAPVNRVVMHLPAGLGIDLRGVATCAHGRLQRLGPAGCPARSLIGRGRAVLEVHAGSQAIPEQASIWAFRAPDRAGHTAVEIFGRGQTPLQEQTISTGVLSADRAPYGSKLTVSIPPIPTVVYEPDASIVSFSLTVGAGPRAHATTTITVPRRCPAGGFPFAADFAFSDSETASASTRVRCP
jgi:hypothetical protein